MNLNVAISEAEDLSTLPDESNPSFWMVCILLPFAGLILGGLAYLVSAVILENRPGILDSQLTDGQQAGLISMPMCALFGATIGLSVALTIGQWELLGVVLLCFVGVIGLWTVISQWNDQIARYGSDSSGIVVGSIVLRRRYVPIVAALLCAASFLVIVLVL